MNCPIVYHKHDFEEKIEKSYQSPCQSKMAAINPSNLLNAVYFLIQSQYSNEIWNTGTFCDTKHNVISYYFLRIQHGRQFKVIDPILPYMAKVAQKWVLLFKPLKMTYQDVFSTDM